MIRTKPNSVVFVCIVSILHKHAKNCAFCSARNLPHLHLRKLGLECVDGHVLPSALNLFAVQLGFGLKKLRSKKNTTYQLAPVGTKRAATSPTERAGLSTFPRALSLASKRDVGKSSSTSPLNLFEG